MKKSLFILPDRYKGGLERGEGGEGGGRHLLPPSVHLMENGGCMIIPKIINFFMGGRGGLQFIDRYNN